MLQFLNKKPDFIIMFRRCPPSGKNYLPDLSEQFLHGGQLCLDGLRQFDLGAAAVEVVFFAMDLEVNISGEIVGQKADTDLQSDKFT